MNIKEYMKDHLVVMDGSTGTMLAQNGLVISKEGTESWNLTHKEIVQKIQKAYFDAGSNLVMMNTFGANAIKYKEDTKLKEIIFAAYDNAAKAREKSIGTQEKFIAMDIGPTGALLEPFGDLEFEQAVEIFSKAVRFGAAAGADMIVIETMMDIEEAKAAVTACKENCDLPILVSHTYTENGRIMMGADPACVVREMEALGIDAVGINCSFGPSQLTKIAEEYLKTATVPVSFKPNAGLPKQTEEGSVYDITPIEFADQVAAMAKKGVRFIGGCCGTTPEYIEKLVSAIG